MLDCMCFAIRELVATLMTGMVGKPMALLRASRPSVLGAVDLRGLGEDAGPALLDQEVGAIPERRRLITVCRSGCVWKATR